MIMPKLLLFSEDKSFFSSIEAGLKDKYELLCLDDISRALDCLDKEKIEIVLIDNDIKKIGGIDALFKIKSKHPKKKTIMLSQKGDITSAVKAAKAGINDFIPKPLDIGNLAESIEKVLASQNTQKNPICFSKEILWLNGISREFLNFIKALEKASMDEKDLVLESDVGIPAKDVAYLIHGIGPNRKKKFSEIDLSSFSRESLEPHFWATIQELLIEPFLDATNEKDMSGTIYLDKFDHISEHFQKSIVEYLKNRQNTSLNKSVKFIMATSNKDIRGFEKISIPKLKERKEDLPLIIDAYINKFSLKYNKEVKGISSRAMNLFVLYDWPGNYRELVCILENCILKSENSFIDVCDIPANSHMAIETSLKKVLSGSDHTLLEAKEKFKKDLYDIALHYGKNNPDLASQFLDIPKTVLFDEIRNLKIKYCL